VLKIDEVEVHDVHSATVPGVLEGKVESVEEGASIEIQQVRKGVHDEVGDSAVASKGESQFHNSRRQKFLSAHVTMAVPNAETADKRHGAIRRYERREIDESL
jgi:hypothetical protein